MLPVMLVDMRNPFVPCKRNLTYSVSILVSVEETLKPLVDRIYMSFRSR